MRLYIVRHAIAGTADPARWPDDSQRPLTERGRRRFGRAARGLRALGAEVDAVLSSPYLRTMETAQILQEEAGWPAPRPYEPLASHGPARRIIDGLGEYAMAGSLALVGHEPDMHLLTSYLLSGEEPAVASAWKKGAVACIDFAGAPSPGEGTLAWFLPPRALRALADE